MAEPVPFPLTPEPPLKQHLVVVGGTWGVDLTNRGPLFL